MGSGDSGLMQDSRGRGTKSAFASCGSQPPAGSADGWLWVTVSGPWALLGGRDRPQTRGGARVII